MTLGSALGSTCRTRYGSGSGSNLHPPSRCGHELAIDARKPKPHRLPAREVRCIRVHYGAPAQASLGSPPQSLPRPEGRNETTRRRDVPLAAQLLERDAELRVVDAAIADAVAGRGRVVILKGEAGIGKSSLVRAAVERARACGLTVLEARGAELERNYPYGAVLDLLGPRVHASEGSLSGPAALAAPIFEAPGSGSADTLALLHGLYWMVLGMTDETPLLIALDDAHWADDASIRFVEYLAQRVGDLRVCLLVAIRPLDEASVESAPRELLSSLQSVSGAGHVEPQRLSTEAVGTMVERHGLADPYGWLRRSAWQATGGNPFMLTELLRTGDAELIRTVGAERWQAGGIPAAISRVIVARLRSAGAGARSLAEAVAVLGDDADLAHAAALAGMTQDEAVAAARRLVEHALFDPGSSLRFIHPIARSAVYGRIPEAVRARDHRRAAALLTESGAPPESVAPHLLRVDPAADQGNVAVLRGAAAAAMRRGDPRSAGALLERAVAEPPREEARVAVLVELAQAQAAVGAEAAVGSYTQALRLSRDPRERAAIRLGLGNALISAARWVDAVEAFERGMREVRADDPLATQLEAGFVSAAWVGMVRRKEVEGRLGRILRAERLEPAQRELATFAAFRSSIEVTGSAAEAMRLVDRALAGMSIDEAVRTGQIVEVAAGVLVTTDQLDREIRLLTDAIDAVQRAGSQAKFGVYSYCRAWPLYFSGRLAEAIADTEQALRAAELGWEV